MSDTVTIRQPSFAALLIDSMDRYPSGYPQTAATSSSQWTLQDRGYVLHGMFERLSVNSSQFFWNLPTVIGGYNDSVILTVGATTATFIVPEGWYSPSTLATAMQTAIQAGGAPWTTFTVTYTNYLIKISNTGAFSINAPGNDSALYETAGLLPGTAILSGGNYLSLATIPTMLATRYIDICSSYLTKFQRVKDKSTLPQGSVSNILARIYGFPNSTATPWPSDGVVPPRVIRDDFSFPKILKWSNEESLTNFDITLYDEYGSILPWKAEWGCEYNLGLSASET
jgi:hypothetical protein